MVKDGLVDKSYESMYGQIKWQLLNLEQEQIMNKWLDDLHKRARIKVNYDLLKQDNKGGAK